MASSSKDFLKKDDLKKKCSSSRFVSFDSGDEIELPKKQIYLLGECTHGTQEFYDIRAEISTELVRERGVKVRLCKVSNITYETHSLTVLIGTRVRGRLVVDVEM